MTASIPISLQPKIKEKGKALVYTMYKLNFDGALCKNCSLAGIGVIIWNHKGLPMASLMSRKENVTAPLAAELYAALQGLQLAHNIGVKRVIIEVFINYNTVFED